MEIINEFLTLGELQERWKCDFALIHPFTLRQPNARGFLDIPPKLQPYKIVELRECVNRGISSCVGERIEVTLQGEIEDEQHHFLEAKQKISQEMTAFKIEEIYEIEKECPALACSPFPIDKYEKLCTSERVKKESVHKFEIYINEIDDEFGDSHFETNSQPLLLSELIVSRWKDVSDELLYSLLASNAIICFSSVMATYRGGEKIYKLWRSGKLLDYDVIGGLKVPDGTIVIQKDVERCENEHPEIFSPTALAPDTSPIDEQDKTAPPPSGEPAKTAAANATQPTTRTQAATEARQEKILAEWKDAFKVMLKVCLQCRDEGPKQRTEPEITKKCNQYGELSRSKIAFLRECMAECLGPEYINKKGGPTIQG